jgi:hypothetical protein
VARWQQSWIPVPRCFLVFASTTTVILPKMRGVPMRNFKSKSRRETREHRGRDERFE